MSYWGPRQRKGQDARTAPPHPAPHTCTLSSGDGVWTWTLPPPTALTSSSLLLRSLTRIPGFLGGRFSECRSSSAANRAACLSEPGRRAYFRVKEAGGRQCGGCLRCGRCGGQTLKFDQKTLEPARDIRAINRKISTSVVRGMRSPAWIDFEASPIRPRTSYVGQVGIFTPSEP